MARPQVREERRAQILDAMYAVIAERGLSGASISEIAEAAGIARGALHYFFHSKDEITTSLMRRMGARYFGELSSALDARIAAGADDPALRERLVADLARWHFLGDNDHALKRFKVWIDYWAQAATREEVRDVVVEIQDNARSLMKRALLAQRPELARLDDGLLRSHCATVLAIIEGALLQWRIAAGTPSALDRGALGAAVAQAAAGVVNNIPSPPFSPPARHKGGEARAAL